MKMSGGNTEFLDKSGLQSTRFAVVSSPKVVKLLSSNIYTNKIRAVIREYSTNAFDAHKAAGVTDLPLVHLPSSFEPFFSVRDYGDGLSEEGMRIFASFFDSNKTDSNDFVGCLGLGSCSAFSLVKTFTVFSYYQGVKTEYLCFEDEEGFPNLTKVHEEPSSERSGLHVIIDVSGLGDGAPFKNVVNEFLAEANEVYKWFDNVPEFTSNNVLKVNKPDYVKITDKTSYIPRYTSSPKTVAVMGGVCYEVPQAYRLKTIDVRLDFEVGELEFDPGREKLSLDARTVAVLKSRIEEFVNGIFEARKSEIFSDENPINQWLRYSKTPDRERGCHPLYKERLKAEIDPKINVPVFTGAYINSQGRKKNHSFKSGYPIELVIAENGRCLTGVQRHCRENAICAFLVSKDDPNFESWSKYMTDGTEFIGLRSPSQRGGGERKTYVKRDFYARRLTKNGMCGIAEKVDMSKTYVYMKAKEYSMNKFENLIRMIPSHMFPTMYVVSESFEHNSNGVHIGNFVNNCVVFPKEITTESEPFWETLSIVDERFDVDIEQNQKVKRFAEYVGVTIPEDAKLIALSEEYKKAYPLIQFAYSLGSSEQAQFKAIVRKLFP